jgi:hypothetical protein
MAQPRACMFCGNRPVTGTHLISLKLQSMLPEVTVGTARLDEWIDETSGAAKAVARDMNVSPLNHQVKRACQQCNGEWMNAYEEATRTLVVKLARGETVEIDNDSARELAMWAIIVAMLRATQDPGEPAFSPADHNAIRTEDAIPEGYSVWAIRGEDRSDLPSRHSRWTIGEVPGHMTWIWIGQLILLVCDTNSTPFIAQRVSVVVKASELVWPAQATGIEWPPTNHVTYRVLYDLTTLALL